MIRFLAAASLLLMLGACSPIPVPPAVGKTAPAGPPPPMPDDFIVCPADVKQCLDGSYVSRNPAKGCAFNPCPDASKP